MERIMSKYIDLTDTISRDNGTLTVYAWRVLKWLDEHPDQVPGPTITKSISRELFEALGDRLLTLADFEKVLHATTGTTVTPDPEPTNAQSIDKLLTEFDNLNASCGGEHGDHDLAEFLTARGVKAPGGDDASKARSDAAWDLNIDRQGGA